jgi:formyltetrahydrofolate synthetase
MRTDLKSHRMRRCFQSAWPRRRRGFSDNAGFLGVPQDFVGSVCSFRVCAGAGFLVAFHRQHHDDARSSEGSLGGEIDVDETGRISAYFRGGK